MLSAMAGLAGMGFQTAGGVFSALGESKAAERSRRAQTRYLEDVTAAHGTQTALERERYLLEEKKAARKEAEILRRVQDRADAAAFQVLSDPNYQAQQRFIQAQFEQGIPDVLAREYAGRLRTAQAARGLERGGAASQQEATLLTKMAHEGRMQLLPQLRQLGFDPQQIQQQAAAAELQALLGAQGAGLGQFQTMLGGAAQAQNIANQRVLPLAQLGLGTMGNLPYSSANPLAYGLFGAGTALTALAGGRE